MTNNNWGKKFQRPMVNPGWVQTDMGGNRASLTSYESAEHIVTLTKGLTTNDAGKFYDWDGKENPW